MEYSIETPQTLSSDERLQICLERDRLLCDPEFQRSPTMSKLLEFLVDHRLSESTRPLKAYTIAVDALGRDESFDTVNDSYPRVQISRLRRVLDNFYLKKGGENRLSIPKNQYQIMLSPNPANAEPSSRIKAHDVTGLEARGSDYDQSFTMSRASASRPTAAEPTPKTEQFSKPLLTTFALLAVLLIGISTYFLFLNKPALEIDYPAIIVMDTAGAVNAVTRDEAKEIETAITDRLSRFDQIALHTVDTKANNRSIYKLQASILDDSGRKINFQLIDRSSNGIVWASTYNLTEEKDLTASLDKAAIAIAAPFGAIVQSELSNHQGDFTPGLPCLLQFNQYLRYRDETIAIPVLECMEKSAQIYPNDPYVLSMVTFARSVPRRFGTNIQTDRPRMDVARRAVQIKHNSASAVFAVAQAAFFTGDCVTGATWGRRAAKLNPLNSRILGYLGLSMFTCKMAEGDEYASRALELDPNVDMSIAAIVALQKLKRGDALGAKQLSKKYMDRALRPQPGLELFYMLSAAKLGDKAEARTYWKRLISRFDLEDDVPVRTLLGKWVANPMLIDEIVVIFDETFPASDRSPKTAF